MGVILKHIIRMTCDYQQITGRPARTLVVSDDLMIRIESEEIEHITYNFGLDNILLESRLYGLRIIHNPHVTGIKII